METEVKIPLADLPPTLARLAAADFHVSVPRLFERNDLYDTETLALRQKEMILRLRQAGDKSVITWKGPGQPGPHKSRPELETTLGSLPVLQEILQQLGYRRVFRYEKYRTEYASADHPGVVTLDETPIGNFLEIEGAADWIDSTALRLGFSPKEYVLDSYGKLYLTYCHHHGVEPGNMVFASH